MSVIEFNCAFCGRLKQVRKAHDAKMFCSKSCAMKWKHEQKRREKQRAGIVPVNGACVFQPESVNCYMKDCDRCGWNPEVAKARLEAMWRKEDG